MTSGIIELEIDEESYEQTRKKLLDLYRLADKASRRIEATEHRGQRTAFGFAIVVTLINLFLVWYGCR